MGSSKQSSLTIAGAFLLLSFFLFHSPLTHPFYALFLLVFVVLYFVVSLALKKALFFLFASTHTNKERTKQPQHQQQQHKLSTRIRITFTTSFQLLKKKEKCLSHLLSAMLQDLSFFSLSFSLASHVFPMPVVSMLVQIILYSHFTIWVEECPP